MKTENGKSKAPIVKGSKSFKYDSDRISIPRLQSRLARNRALAKMSKDTKRIKEAEEDQHLARLQRENAELRLQHDTIKQMLIASQVCLLSHTASLRLVMGLLLSHTACLHLIVKFLLPYAAQYYERAYCPNLFHYVVCV
jgi:hypothetical protein